MLKNLKSGMLSGLVGLALIANGTPIKAQTTTYCPTTGTTSSTNLVVCSASYLGGTSDDNGAAVDIGSDQNVVLVGTIIGQNFGLIPTNLKAGSSTTAGGNGAIIRTGPAGRTILSVTRLGNVLDGVSINSSNGHIAVAGDFGLALLNNTAKQVLWSKNLGPGGGAQDSNGRRVAVGSKGEVAALFNQNVYIYSDAGAQLGTFTVKPQGGYGFYVEDVAIDSVSQTVIVTGFSQKNDGGCSPEQVAFVRGYSYTGTLKWTDYDWTDNQTYSASQSCADTRGERVSIGKDGKLYFAAQSAGGNNIFRFDPQNISQAAPNVQFDAYNTPYNTSSNHITYYARLDPKTGIYQKGQYALARIDVLSGNPGNTLVVGAITADAKGNVYMSGTATYEIANRSNLHISGQPVGPYEHDGEGFLLVVPPDFSSRKVWTVWSGPIPQDTTAGSGFNGVATGLYGAAVVGTTNQKMITVNPVQSSNKGGYDAFFSVFPLVP